MFLQPARPGVEPGHSETRTPPHITIQPPTLRLLLRCFCKCIPLLKVLLHVPRRYALPLPFRDVYSATAIDIKWAELWLPYRAPIRGFPYTATRFLLLPKTGLSSYLSNKYATGNSDCRGSSAIPIFVILCISGRSFR